MAFICEDVGTTKRKKMTRSRALKRWEAHKGICITCERKINPGERWFIEHKRALELGGEDTDANCAPAHYACKAVKDAEDHGRAAKAKRAKQSALGIKDENRAKIKSPGFPAPVKTPKTLTKALPPRRSLYQPEVAK